MMLSAPPFVIPHTQTSQSQSCPCCITYSGLGAILLQQHREVSLGLSQGRAHHTTNQSCFLLVFSQYKSTSSYCSSTGGFPWDFPRGCTNQLCFLSSMWSPVVYKNKEKVISHSQAFSGQCLARLSVSTCTQDLYSSKVAWGGLLTYPYLRHYWLTYSIEEDLRDFVPWVLSMCTYSQEECVLPNYGNAFHKCTFSAWETSTAFYPLFLSIQDTTIIQTHPPPLQTLTSFL